ncbi:hypothetical protein FACS189413_17140 [Bacteroidia bacterium]|nr:hypothetical protein FACS189413_17140 [Bacteroidia bacterium]
MKKHLLFLLLFVATAQLNAQQVIKVTNTNESGAGSLKAGITSVLNKSKPGAENGYIVEVDESLRGKTITLNSRILHHVDGIYTIKGNGIILTAGNKIDPRAINKQLFDLNPASSPVVVEDITFLNCDVNAYYADHLTFRNCRFINNNVRPLCLRITGTGRGRVIANTPKVILEGCSFISTGNQPVVSITYPPYNDDDPPHAGAWYGFPIRAEFTSCSFLSTGVSNTEANIIAYRDHALAQKEAEITLTNCVLVDHHSSEKSSLFAPVIKSNGYNVIKGSIDPSVQTNQLLTTGKDLLNTTMADPITQEDNFLKVVENGTAYQNLPANTLFSGFPLPVKDVSGRIIDYTQPTHSGACQLLVGQSGIENISLTASVYPNPFSDYIIVNTRENSQVVVYNLSGQAVAETTFVAGENRMNLSHLAAGAYLLKYGTHVLKLIAR